MRILVTGGAGFIGCNIAKRFLDKGNKVIIFDNLSRRGADKNLAWLRAHVECKTTSLDRRDIPVPPNGGVRKPRLSQFRNGLLAFVKGDIRDSRLLNKLFNDSAFGKIDLVFHMAAQVAVTTSVVNPREDFDINALGTFNLLEAIRNSKQKPVIINASTNKVYGKMESVKIKEKKTRYVYEGLPHGVSEEIPLDFYSPYGCSKGSGDQYIIDYARIYGMKTINFRQSCIYGPRQLGVEDQGWVAHFIISAVLGRPITIYGDGKQVRDVLFIDDLVDAFLMAVKNIGTTRGRAYNIGGGVKNSISLLEFIAILEETLGEKIALKFGGWRPGDQKLYLSDIRRAKKDFGWAPKIEVKKGIYLLIEWVRENRKLFNDF